MDLEKLYRMREDKEIRNLCMDFSKKIIKILRDKYELGKDEDIDFLIDSAISNIVNTELAYWLVLVRLSSMSEESD